MVLKWFKVPGFPSLETSPADHLVCMLPCEGLSVSVTESKLHLKLYCATRLAMTSNYDMEPPVRQCILDTRCYRLCIYADLSMTSLL
jgi:hypothetical protein